MAKANAITLLLGATVFALMLAGCAAQQDPSAVSAHGHGDSQLETQTPEPVGTSSGKISPTTVELDARSVAGWGRLLGCDPLVRLAPPTFATEYGQCTFRNAIVNIYSFGSRTDYSKFILAHRGDLQFQSSSFGAFRALIVQSSNKSVLQELKSRV
jgi:hypothetical protein